MSAKICYEWLNRLQCAGVPFLCNLATARTSGPRFRVRLLKLRDEYAGNEAAKAIFDEIEAWRGNSSSSHSNAMLVVPVTPLDDLQDNLEQEPEASEEADQESPEGFQEDIQKVFEPEPAESKDENQASTGHTWKRKVTQVD